MLVRERGSRSASRRSLQETILHEKRLVHFFDRSFILADSSRDCLHADWTAIEFLDDRLENSCVHVVEAELIDVEQLESFLCDIACDVAACFHLREIANASQ